MWQSFGVASFAEGTNIRKRLKRKRAVNDDLVTVDGFSNGFSVKADPLGQSG